MANATFKVLASAHNASSVNAGSDILAAVSVARNGILHIAVAVDTSTAVQLGVSDGSTTELLDLNGGASLLATKAYAFTFPAISGYSYSLVNDSGGSASTIQHAVLMLETPV